MGRPSLKTPELIETLLERLVLSDRGLEGVCEAADMPGLTTVFRWLQEDAGFRELYTRAREQIADVQAFRGLRDAVAAPDPAAARVQLDARKWLASKLDAKRYGDKTLIGSDPENPLPSQTLDLTGISTAALKELAKLAPNS